MDSTRSTDSADTGAPPPAAPPQPHPEVSIILPIHNQEDHLAATIGSYLSVLEMFRHSFEVILVVNGNTDRSLEISHHLARSSPHVRVLEEQLAGWGRAVRAGLRASRGHILAFTNSARTSAYTLGLLVTLASANPGYILKANRRLRYPLIRRIGSVLYNFQCRTLFGLAVWDINGTPKVFRRETLEILDLHEDSDLIDLEFIVKCRRHNIPVLEVPVVSSPRHGGRSTTKLASALALYRGAFHLRRTLGRAAPPPPAGNDA